MQSKEIGEQRQTNWLLWTGVLSVVLGVALGIVPFVAQIPGQVTLPWLNLLLSVLAVVLVITGLRRATRDPLRYRGKAMGWIFAVLSSVLLLFSSFMFYFSRQIPGVKAAPQIGQKAPDFELKDTNGKNISLAELLAEPFGPGQDTARPKAVLLVFYRGYW